VFEEGITTLSLFNPDYAHGHLMDSGFIPALGIAGPWTVTVITLHVVWSMCTPIALVELFVPDRRTTPWLGRTGLIVSGVLLVVGAAMSLIGTEGLYPFTPTAGEMVGAVLVIAVLVFAGLRTGRGHHTVAGRTAPSPWIVGGTALVLAAAYKEMPGGWNPWLVTVLVPAIGVCMIAAVVYWSASPNWNDRHRLALVTAALTVYAVTAFWQVPMMGASPAVELAGHVVLAIGAATLVVLAARRVRTEGAPAPVAVTAERS
jgi:peptidoglycan/LPS O-acetylase OafA/YrhL